MNLDSKFKERRPDNQIIMTRSELLKSTSGFVIALEMVTEGIFLLDRSSPNKAVNCMDLENKYHPHEFLSICIFDVETKTIFITACRL